MLGEEVEGPEDREEEQRDGEVGPGESPVEVAPHVQHRAGVPQLPQDERDEPDARHDRGGDGLGAPAEVRSLNDHVDEGADRDHREQPAHVVDPVLVSGLRRRHEDEGADDREHRDRHVDQERRGPAVVLQECARDERSGRDGEPGGGRPQDDRLGPLGAREARGEQRERGRHDHRRADAHDGAGRDDAGRTGDEGSGDGSPAEDDEPQDERPAPAVLVADRTEQQHQGCVRNGVAVDDPLQVGAAEPQVLGHVGGGDRQSGVRHHDDQQAQAQHQQRPPAAPVRPVHLRDRLPHDQIHNAPSSPRLAHDCAITHCCAI